MNRKRNRWSSGKLPFRVTTKGILRGKSLCVTSNRSAPTPVGMHANPTYAGVFVWGRMHISRWNDPVCGESPRAELPGVVGSSIAPPGEDASEATVLVCAGVHCCASTSSRSVKRAVIDRVGRSTISIPWQRSSSSIHSGIRICIPLDSATCTWCSPKEEHFRILVTVAP